MIKKNLIFHSFFLLVISIWLILIFNVVLTTFTSSFLISPSFSPFTGYFAVFYWAIVGVSAASSFAIGLDKLGIGQPIWKKIIGKKDGKKKSKVVKVPKKPKTSKKKSIPKKKVNVKQKIIIKHEIKEPKVDNEQIIKAIEKDRQRSTDSLKAFYLFGETEFSNCKHKLGYLGKRLKNKPIPDDCFGCPKILDCFKSSKKTKKNKKPILTTTL
jgi:hypothetical protein